MSSNVNFGIGLITVERDWTPFKDFLNGNEKTLSLQYETLSDRYELFAVDENIAYRCEIFLSGFEPAGSDVTQITNDRNDFLANYAPTANKQLQTRDAVGALIIAARDGGLTISGFSGYSGAIGVSGWSGVSGIGGSGYSGTSGLSAFSGNSGYSGVATFSYDQGGLVVSNGHYFMMTKNLILTGTEVLTLQGNSRLRIT